MQHTRVLSIFACRALSFSLKMKMKTKLNEDCSNITCLWGLRQLRKKSQRCRRAVMNLLELAMALSCQSRCLLWAEITAQVCTVLPTCKHPKQSDGEELSWM